MTSKSVEKILIIISAKIKIKIPDKHIIINPIKIAEK